MSHDHNHGSTPSSPSTSPAHDTMMVPYLHFGGGDNLLFKAWTPSSAGAIAGACIGLALVALLERWLRSLRSVFSDHWHDRALSMCAECDKAVIEQFSLTAECKHDSSSDANIEPVDEDPSNSQIAPASSPRAYPHLRRTIAPFIAAYDIPRGLLYAIQMLLTYTLMLAVMTFQAAYIISIIVGLGLGEILFGRAAHVPGVH